jgi:hypothetical protein
VKYVIKCSGCGSDKDFVRYGTMMDLLECKCDEQTYMDAGELVEENDEK